MQSSKGFREKGKVFKASIFELHHLLGFGFYCKPPQSALELLSSPIAILSLQTPAMNPPKGNFVKLFTCKALKEPFASAKMHCVLLCPFEP